MVVHKRTAKAIKKRIRKHAQSVIEKAQREDVLPSIPSVGIGPLQAPPLGLVGLAAVNPRLALIIATYMAVEKTEQYWGHPLYGRFLPPEEIPGDPWMIPEGYGVDEGKSRAPTKTKRKISKANRAMKMSYDFYRRKFKGKMTQKKCREIMRKASKMAGKANPHTKSRIGKGGDWIKRHCRKVRKGVWNTTKRTYGR